MTLKFLVAGQKLTYVAARQIVANTINYIACEFKFQTSDWDGLSKWVHFAKDGEEPYEAINLGSDDTIPESYGLDLTEGEWTVWVHGNYLDDSSETIRITTSPVTFPVLTYSGNEEVLPTITPTVAEQIDGKATRAEKAKITSATATISNTVGTPTVAVSIGGEDYAHSLDFVFTNMKGRGIASIVFATDGTITVTYDDGNTVTFTGVKEAIASITATEASVEAAEALRVLAETARVNAENLRVTAESGRVTAESGRVTAEQGRVSAENTRVSNEATRQQKWGAASATATGLSAGASPTVEVTQDTTGTHYAFGIPKGDTGKGITSIVKTSTAGNVDTYTITYTDGTTTTFTVTNGTVISVNGKVGTVTLDGSDVNVDNTASTPTTIKAAIESLDTDKVPTSRTVNNKALSSDIEIEAQDIFFDCDIRGKLQATDTQSAIDELTDTTTSQSSQIASIQNLLQTFYRDSQGYLCEY